MQLMLCPGIVGQLREHSVAGGHLRQMHLRLDADPFEGLQLVGGERVVQIFGHGVEVFREAPAIRFWGTDGGPSDGRTDPVHEVRRHHAGRDLRAELLLVVTGKDAIQPGQQGSEGETHGLGSGGRRGSSSSNSGILRDFSYDARKNPQKRRTFPSRSLLPGPA